MNRSQFVYKPCISFTNLASGVQNWRFVYKYSLFNFKTSISDYKLASRITTQRAELINIIIVLLFAIILQDYHAYKSL